MLESAEPKIINLRRSIALSGVSNQPGIYESLFEEHCEWAMHKHLKKLRNASYNSAFSPAFDSEANPSLSKEVTARSFAVSFVSFSISLFPFDTQNT